MVMGKERKKKKDEKKNDARTWKKKEKTRSNVGRLKKACNIRDLCTKFL